jgi:hypothetical protein
LVKSAELPDHSGATGSEISTEMTKSSQDDNDSIKSILVSKNDKIDAKNLLCAAVDPARVENVVAVS